MTIMWKVKEIKRKKKILKYNRFYTDLYNTTYCIKFLIKLFTCILMLRGTTEYYFRSSLMTNFDMYSFNMLSQSKYYFNKPHLAYSKYHFNKSFLTQSNNSFNKSLPTQNTLCEVWSIKHFDFTYYEEIASSNNYKIWWILIVFFYKGLFIIIENFNLHKYYLKATN